MTLKNTATRYGTVARTLHWLTAMLVLAMFALGLGRDYVSRETAHMMMNWHRPIGITILALVVVRLGWRFFISPPPPLPGDLPPPMKFASHMTHGGLYAMLLLMTLTGWATTSAGGHVISYFGLFNVPPLVGVDKRVDALTGEVHSLAGWVLMGLIGVHIAAALYHQFVRGDEVLGRMAPMNEPDW